jgi:hypothetical protein
LESLVYHHRLASRLANRGRGSKDISELNGARLGDLALPRDITRMFLAEPKLGEEADLVFARNLLGRDSNRAPFGKSLFLDRLM